MSMIRVIQIGGKDVVVEVDPMPIPNDGGADSFKPEGSELTGVLDRARDAASMIENSIEGLATATIGALKNVAPDEVSIEIGMAFKGEHSPIPVLVKVGGEASFKVTAKWKKS